MAKASKLSAIALVCLMLFTSALAKDSNILPEPEITVAAKGEADLPRVLLLGDSISLGYEQPMRKLLAGRASVHHPPENCQSTAYGLKKIDQWLGDNPWDVIHFNWGIWDAHHLKDDRLRTTPEEYEQNLRKLVSRLKTTGAKLIWASTTPLTGRVEQGGIWVEGSEIPRRNEIARKMMDESGILVDDLYQAVLPHIDRYQSADNCHFTPEGSAFLACRVAGTVESMLKADARRGVSISNALDLGDWTVFPKGTSSIWQFEAGILKCSGKPASYMRTVKDFENYHLQFEWRWPDLPGNSGVLLNVTGKDNVWPECIECQLHSGDAGDIWLGKNTELTVRNKRYQVRNEGYEAGKHALRIPSDESSAELPLGQWNRCDIYCQNGNIKCYINGIMMNQGESASRKKGKICFQSEGTPIDFRNIRIQSLNQ